MSITLTTIRNFVEVAKSENYSAAAKRLFTAQSNLSKNISGLERSLGVTLFYKDGRNVKLTNTGKYLYQEWSSALECIDRSIHQARQMEQAQMECISLGLVEGITIAPGTPDVLEEFRKANPNIRLQLERGSLATIWNDFQARSFDLITVCECRGSTHPASPPWARQVLFATPGAAAINIRNPLAQRDTLTLSMMKDEDFVSLSQTTVPEGTDTLMEVCSRAGFEPRIIREASSVESLLLYVELGMGVALLSENTRLAYNPNIRVIPLKDISFDVSVYWHPDAVTPGVKKILEIVRSKAPKK